MISPAAILLTTSGSRACESVLAFGGYIAATVCMDYFDSSSWSRFVIWCLSLDTSDTVDLHCVHHRSQVPLFLDKQPGENCSVKRENLHSAVASC